MKYLCASFLLDNSTQSSAEDQGPSTSKAMFDGSERRKLGRQVRNSGQICDANDVFGVSTTWKNEESCWRKVVEKSKLY